MKKVFFILLALIFSLGNYNQCIKKYDFKNKQNIITNNFKSNYISYCAKEKTIENRIYFNYPQIENGLNAEKINNIIIVFVENELQKYIQDGFYGDVKSSPESWEWDNDQYTLQAMNINYKVTRDDSEYLSITFEGLYNYKNSAYPIHYFNALVIDVNKYELITLSNLYDIDLNFIQLVQQELLNKINKDAKSEYVDSFYKELEMSIQNGDYAIYLTDEYLGFSVFTGHVFGDHYEIMINYNKLNKFIKK